MFRLLLDLAWLMLGLSELLTMSAETIHAYVWERM